MSCWNVIKRPKKEIWNVNGKEGNLRKTWRSVSARWAVLSERVARHNWKKLFWKRTILQVRCWADQWEGATCVTSNGTIEDGPLSRTNKQRPPSLWRQMAPRSGYAQITCCPTDNWEVESETLPIDVMSFRLSSVRWFHMFLSCRNGTNQSSSFFLLLPSFFIFLVYLFFIFTLICFFNVVNVELVWVHVSINVNKIGTTMLQFSLVLLFSLFPFVQQNPCSWISSFVITTTLILMV